MSSSQSYIPNRIIDTVGDTINKELEPEKLVIEMAYMGWMCPCAQWVTPENYEEYIRQQTAGDSPSDSLFYYIFPKNDTVPHPFELSENKDTIYHKYRFTGRFYKDWQYTFDEGELGPARSFLYEKVEVILD